MTTPAVLVDNVTCSYAGKKALDAVTLTIPRGTNFALLGPNGAGKTTLISILCTLQKPDAGAVSVAGVDVLRRPTQARKSIGVVFQDSSLDDRLTAWENLDFHGLVYGMAGKWRRERIAEVLDLVELADWRDEVVRSFSGGMRRRLEIARALLHEPALLFLDEPTVGLDAQTRQRIWAYLEQLRRERELTVFTTTHYIEEVEGSDQICIINDGRIVAEGTPQSLKDQHGSGWLNVLPRDHAARDTVIAAYPQFHDLGHGRLAIPVAGPDKVEALLGQFGGSLTEARYEAPSLESVFLSLTGRELRDRMAGRRDIDQAAGRRAGRR